jgi:hypothetical protein
MSKTSNLQKLSTLKIWLAEKELQIRRGKNKKPRISYEEE